MTRRRLALRYIGVQARLVVTPQTERARLAITQALKDCVLVSTNGVNTCGNQEILKDLAGACAVPLFVLPLHSTTTADTIARVLSGVCSAGAWCCITQLDQLGDAAVAQAASHMVRMLCTHVPARWLLAHTWIGVLQLHSIERARRNKVPTVTLAPKRTVSVGTSTAIFSTLALAPTAVRAGEVARTPQRTRLPAFLSEMFRPVTVLKPDAVRVASLMLESMGFDADTVCTLAL